MKILKQLGSIGIALLTISSVYACNTNERRKPIELIAHATNPVEPKKDNTVQIALLLDTSNSMDGLINQAKSQLWDIVNEFSLAKCGNDTRPNLQIAIYQYGNDNLSASEGYIQQVLGFSSDLDEISEKLFSLTTNGGEEYCGKVLQTSLQQLPWNQNPDLLRMIFIAGNEPFDQGRYNYRNATTNANEKGVTVNTIFCGNYELGINTDWKKGASLTGGEYLAIDHNKKVVHINTPYDDIIIKLNSKLNTTYISYGTLGREKYQAQKVQDENALEMEEAIAVKRAVSKSSRLYNNKKWDLVDAYADEEFEISTVEKDQLPNELKNKNEKEIKDYIESKKAERIQIQKEIQEYNSKRLAYIAEHQNADKSGELENAMIKAIKKQAESKNYSWE
ncbi:von Willebrand factor type A domain-containing protein [Maribacter dokdonensis]|uniref:von Willebrand factor type A domain-containing protein n=1 Tax=Maribacter dokdonensis TaxID=320912 RepID=A0A1H4N022_9FLAO|nr:vWA domain-containing protein [Maribacter dokdonensis]SEB88095.1 von Willebrand factor type A domain-containing protein [Maribacter dokdonensis]